MRLWKDDARPDAQELIDFLLETHKKGGWGLSRKHWIAWSELMFSSAQSSLRRGTVGEVLSQMSERGMTDIATFETLYAEKSRKKARQSNAETLTWKVFLPIAMRVDAGVTLPAPVTVSRRRWCFVSRASFERSFRNGEISRTLLAVMGKRTDLTNDVFLTSSYVGADWTMAWAALQPSFDLLRGWIELLLGLGGFRILMPTEAPRHHVPHPPWVIARARGRKPEAGRFLYVKADEVKPVSLTQEFIERLRRFTRSLPRAEEDESSQSVVAAALRLYAQAMDAYPNHACLLALWQAAETIAAPVDRTGRTDLVCRRLGWLGKDEGYVASGWQHSLDWVGKKQRNAVVHRGSQVVSEDEITILKSVVEAAIGWLHEESSRLPSRTHLEQYFRHRTSNDAQLEAVQGAVAQIQQQRRSR